MRPHFTFLLAWAATWPLSARNGRRFMRPLLFVTLVLCFAHDFVIGRATAIEVQCIEASKYKYLYQIFGGDSKKFAAYLQLDAGKLPNPEHCRAALISGRIEAPQAKDADKLLAVITQNQGWLAALHLASGGGKIGTGYQLGFLARNFWLKTYTVSTLGSTLVYEPDFFVPPLTIGSTPAPAPEPSPETGPAEGWQGYLAAQKKLAPVSVSNRGCASACGLIQVAGVDRFGLVHVHRSRYSGNDSFIDLSKSMSATNEGLMQSEEVQVSYYRQMDPGPDFIRLYQSTPPETVTPAEVTRYPRYVADYLNAKCNADVGQLQRLERQLRITTNDLGSPLFGLWIKTDQLREAAKKVREQRSQAEQCVAAAHEKERLATFAKLCGNGCDRQKVLATVDGKIRELGKAPR
jgi:hypothetical protein